MLNLCFSALKKHGTGLCSMLKRLVCPFSKDSADLLSALLDFLRQIFSTEPMVTKWFKGLSNLSFKSLTMGERLQAVKVTVPSF